MVKPRLAFVFAASVCVGLWFTGASAFSRKGAAPRPSASGAAASGAGAVGASSAVGGAKSPAAPVTDQVWVSRSDGAESCAPKSGQSLEEGAAELKKAGVRVLDQRKGDDGKMHMQMCGAPTGSMNAYLIARDDLPKAIAHGFAKSATH